MGQIYFVMSSEMMSWGWEAGIFVFVYVFECFPRCILSEKEQTAVMTREVHDEDRWYSASASQKFKKTN